MAYNAVESIMTKRDGGRLDDGQIRWLIDAYTRGEVADEQMSAMAMAVFFNGLDDQELATWTEAMIRSGERLDFSGLKRFAVDKHSTGGVGDKVTLILAPLVAACGAAVPQLSGRGLGHTGGTLDKMEAIPGWRADLSDEAMRRQLDDVGAVICAAGASLCPADKKLYALRDVTGTVESIPLICSSIMSKKIAEGASGLVLDVKVGSGAFMKTPQRARELATRLVGLGKAAGVATVALLTDMSTPLGLTAGNALEVAEAVDVLAGGGPSDVVEITLALAREMVRAQGGDPAATLPVASHQQDVTAPASGYVTAVDAYDVGVAAWRLGAGRARKEDAVQAGAGVVLRVKPGDRVNAGDTLMTLHTDTPERIADATILAAKAVTIADKPQASQPLIIDRVA
jgi:thymidine phosphorylase